MKPFDYLEPTTVAEACELLRRHGGEARLYAGGAYLSIVMKQGLLQPKILINIKRIAELKDIDCDPQEGLSIGALVTHRELETSELIREKLPLLCEVEKEVANIRVRNVGTVGGNLASGEPLTDLAQVFIALDAQVEILGSSGKRVISLEELFIDSYQTCMTEDEILTRVLIPPLPSHSGVEYIRFSSSSVVDKPCVGVAVWIALDPAERGCRDVRIVMGCVGPTPMRARQAEQILIGKAARSEVIQEAAKRAAQECNPVSDLRGSESYKRAVVHALVRRALTTAAGRASEK
jgi:carbon-monoxide dehydrogenase medium subunit